MHEMVLRFALAGLPRRGYICLLNAGCLGNVEYTRAGQRRIRRLLDGLAGIGVTNVTVATPFLLRLIKTAYADFNVRVSVFAAVNDVRQVRYVESLASPPDGV